MNRERVRTVVSVLLARGARACYISRMAVVRIVRKAWYHAKRIWPNIALPLGWGLLTWAGFGWSSRAWAASAGLFCFTWVGLEMYGLYATTKANNSREQ